MNKKIFTMMLAGALLLVACGGGGTPTAAAGGAGLCANDYMPVLDGATWNYLSTGPTGDYAFTNTVSNVAADGFTMTTTFDDFALAQEWSCSAEGLAQLEFSPGPEANLTGRGISATYETTSMTGVTLPPHISAGDTWTQTFNVNVAMTMAEGTMSATGSGAITQTFTAIGVESISTAASTFDAMKVDSVLHVEMALTMDNGTNVPVVLDTQADMFWVEGVGLIHSDSTSTISGSEPIVVNADLQTYAIPEVKYPKKKRPQLRAFLFLLRMLRLLSFRRGRRPTGNPLGHSEIDSNPFDLRIPRFARNDKNQPFGTV